MSAEAVAHGYDEPEALQHARHDGCLELDAACRVRQRMMEATRIQHLTRACALEPTGLIRCSSRCEATCAQLREIVPVWPAVGDDSMTWTAVGACDRDG